MLLLVLCSVVIVFRLVEWSLTQVANWLGTRGSLYFKLICLSLTLAELLLIGVVNILLSSLIVLLLSLVWHPSGLVAGT